MFQRGDNRPDYLLALPDLISYYSLIDAASLEPLRIPEVSATGREWWIVHRQRAQYQPGDLAHALAVEQSAVFHQPVDDFTAHATARAEAMDLCDTGSGEWTKIQSMLDQSWSALHIVVNRQGRCARRSVPAH